MGWWRGREGIWWTRDIDTGKRKAPEEPTNFVLRQGENAPGSLWTMSEILQGMLRVGLMVANKLVIHIYQTGSKKKPSYYFGQRWGEGTTIMEPLFPLCNRIGNTSKNFVSRCVFFFGGGWKYPLGNGLVELGDRQWTTDQRFQNSHPLCTPYRDQVWGNTLLAVMLWTVPAKHQSSYSPIRSENTTTWRCKTAGGKNTQIQRYRNFSGRQKCNWNVQPNR